MMIKKLMTWYCSRLVVRPLNCLGRGPRVTRDGLLPTTSPGGDALHLDFLFLPVGMLLGFSFV